MGRRRSAALRDVAGTHHVVSRLSYEGFRATLGPGTADVLANLPGGSACVAVAVRTARCPEGFGGRGKGVVCEWWVGRGLATEGDTGPFVALVDAGHAEWSPRVWVVPSRGVREGSNQSDEGRPYRYRATAEELAEHEEHWDAVEEHLLGMGGPREAWFVRGELGETYGKGFVEALDEESSRLLGVQNSVVHRMADGRFPAGDLADAQALLSVLFRRFMQQQRDRREEAYRRRKDGRRRGAGA